jgi:hypothetical protein
MGTNTAGEGFTCPVIAKKSELSAITWLCTSPTELRAQKLVFSLPFSSFKALVWARSIKGTPASVHSGCVSFWCAAIPFLKPAS